MTDPGPPRTGENGLHFGGMKKKDVGKQFCFLLTDPLGQAEMWCSRDNGWHQSPPPKVREFLCDRCWVAF